MTDTQELDPKLAENPHYWLYRATREQIAEAKSRGQVLPPNEYYWNRWAVEGLSREDLDKYEMYSTKNNIGSNQNRIERLSLSSLNIIPLDARTKEYILNRMNSLSKRYIQKKSYTRFIPIQNKLEFPQYNEEINFTDIIIDEHKHINIDDFIFISRVTFQRVTFEHSFSLHNSIFINSVTFIEVTFNHHFSLCSSIFYQGIRCYCTNFNGYVRILGSDLGNFCLAEFSCEGDFIIHGSKLNRFYIHKANQSHQRFNLFKGNILFERVEISDRFDLTYIDFPNKVYFKYTKFLGDVYFDCSMFQGDVDFLHSRFGTNNKPINISFWQAEFKEKVFHDGVKFYGKKINFKNTKYFGEIVGFVETEYHFHPENNYYDKFSFENTVFATEVNFKDAQFFALPDFAGADFRGGINLDRTEFPPSASSLELELFNLIQTIEEKKTELAEKFIQMNRREIEVSTEEYDSIFDKIFIPIQKFFEENFNNMIFLALNDNLRVVNFERKNFISFISCIQKRYGNSKEGFQNFLLEFQSNLCDEHFLKDYNLTKSYNNLNDWQLAGINANTIKGKLKSYEDASIAWHALSTEMEKAGYHDQALKYFGYELEAKRLSAKTEKKDVWQWLLFSGYKYLSDYGQSVVRPFVAWLSLIPLFFVLHLFLLCKVIEPQYYWIFILFFGGMGLIWIASFLTKNFVCTLFGAFIGIWLFSLEPSLQALQLSLKGAIPFVSDQTTFYDRMFGDAKEQESNASENSLISFNNSIQESAYMTYGIERKASKEPQNPIPFNNSLELYIFPFLHGLHTIFSLLCLFLFGLGIRNRLRLK